MGILILYKPVGYTPLQLINNYKIKYKMTNIKFSFAGRLDPMAHGLMIYLYGDTCKLQDQYISFDKIYEFKLMLGVSTDTNDILGIINNYCDSNNISMSSLQTTIYNYFRGEIKQYYPKFSSKTINGTPLWKLALENNIQFNEIPYKYVNIHNIEILSKEYYKSYYLIPKIINKIKLMKSNTFRNEEIIKLWNKLKENLGKKTEFVIFKMKAKVSSGTYIRELCKNIGEIYNLPALALDIYRTDVGNYNVLQSSNIILKEDYKKNNINETLKSNSIINFNIIENENENNYENNDNNNNETKL